VASVAALQAPWLAIGVRVLKRTIRNPRWSALVVTGGASAQGAARWVTRVIPVRVARFGFPVRLSAVVDGLGASRVYATSTGACRQQHQSVIGKMKRSPSLLEDAGLMHRFGFPEYLNATGHQIRDSTL